MLNRIFLIILCLLAQDVYSTTYVPQPLAVYYEGADIVAVVQILSGEAIEIEHEGEQLWCAAKYKARVHESYKGKDDVITFVSSDEYFKLGDAYLVFIENKKQARTPIMSSSHMSDGGGSMDKINKCQSNLKGNKPNWLATSHFIASTRKKNTEGYTQWVTPPYNIIASEDVVWEKIKIKTITVNGEEVSHKDSWQYSGHPLPEETIYYDGALTWDSYKAHMLKQIESVK